MPHTDRTTVLATYIKDKIDAAKVSLGIDTVLYGEQDNMAQGMVAVVNSGTKTRRLARVAFPGGGTMNFMTVLITIYNSKVGSEGANRLLVDQTAESVEHLLHQDTTMGGNIIHGFVETWDPGIRFRTTSMFRVTQLIFVGQTKTNLTDIP